MSTADPPRAMPMASAPMAMAAMPAPAPTPAPLAAVPERTRVSFSAESPFGFDPSTWQPAGREAPDAFTKRSDGARDNVVLVEGHTDRLGSTHHNQMLSLQRAEAVKACLVASGRFDALKVSTSGKGETSPVTKPGDGTGSRQTPALIAGLKADRRVEVEMSGTRRSWRGDRPRATPRPSSPAGVLKDPALVPISLRAARSAPA